MARQDGPIFLRGEISGLIFYKRGNGYFVRSKGAPIGEQIKHSPKFERVRENMREFKNCAKSGMLLRRAAGAYQKSFDMDTAARVVQLMSKIKQCDTTALRGDRTVARGLQNDAGKSLLRGFDLNKNKPMCSVLLKPCTVTNGTMELRNLVPARDMKSPKGTTHYEICGITAVIDFETGNSRITNNTTVRGQLDKNEVDLVLQAPVAYRGNGLVVRYLCLRFYNLAQQPVPLGKQDSICVMDVADRIAVKTPRVRKVAVTMRNQLFLRADDMPVRAAKLGYERIGREGPT